MPQNNRPGRKARGLTVHATVAVLLCPHVAAAAEKIVFVSDRDANNEIYTMDTDGSNQTRLTTDAGNDHDPTWAPGGARVAFVSNRGGNSEIYVMNADGTGQTNLTNDAGSDIEPAWSPDGGRIAFASNRTGGYEIWVMNADGSGATQLTSAGGDDREPAWSPDGAQIAFNSFRDSDWEIYVMDADGGNQTNTTNSVGTDQEPAWSPDGGEIAFISIRGGDLDTELYKMNSDGTGQTALTANSVQDVSPFWSRDGAKIVYSTFSTANDEVYTINPDGTGLANLSNNAAADGYPRWSWGPHVVYRSIGTDTGTLHSAGTATMSTGTVTMTFSGTTLPAHVGLGDRIDIQGSMAIQQQETVTGAGETSPVTVSSIQGGTSQTYVLLIATRNNADVTNVTGGAGLTWTQQAEQCSGNGTTRCETWTAQGSPGAAFTPQITFTPNDTVAAVLVRYSGVGTLEDAHGRNTNGPGGACTGGTDDKTALLTLTSSADGSAHLIGVNPERNTLSGESAGYTMVNSVVGGSGLSQQRLAVYGRTLDPAAADPFQVGINKNTDWSTSGLVLNPADGAETFYIKRRDSDTQVTVHTAAAAIHTNETYTITRAFNTLQAWEDDRQGDLVAGGRRETGVCYNDGVFTAPLVISGSTTDAESYMAVTVAEGQRHTGLYSTGARMDAPGGTFGADAITVEDEYTRVEWLLIEGVTDYEDAVFFAGTPASDNSLAANVFVHSFWQGGNAAFRVDAPGVTVRNCVATGGTTYGVFVGATGSAMVESCTLWGFSGGGYGVYSSQGDVSVRNTISVDHGTLDVYVETAGTATLGYFGYNMYSSYGGGFDPALEAGGDQSPPADFEDLFVSLTTPVDLHLHAAGHNALGTGLDLSAVFTDDIDGQGRGSWDLGADEVAYNYRSIGTNAAILYSTGTATIEQGSTTVTFGSGASLPATVGVGDQLAIGAAKYYLVARNSPTQATIHAGAATAHSSETYGIKRSYNTIQAWEAARDGDLVTAGAREAGVCYADGVLTAGVYIDGSITDAEHFLKLTAAEGQRHDGTAGSGVVVDFGGAADSIGINDPYTVVEWLEVADSGGIPVDVYASLSGILLRNLLVHDSFDIDGCIRIRSATTVRNSIIYDGDLGIKITAAGDATIENVTIYNMFNEAVRKFSGGGSVSAHNTIAAGNGGTDFSISDPELTAFGYNLYDTVSGFSPSNYEGGNSSPPASLEDLFISTVAMLEDLHLEPLDRTAGNAGKSLSASFTDDVDGATRTGTWDIGADEGVPGTAGTTPTIVSWREVEP